MELTKKKSAAQRLRTLFLRTSILCAALDKTQSSGIGECRNKRFSPGDQQPPPTRFYVTLRRGTQQQRHHYYRNETVTPLRPRATSSEGAASRGAVNTFFLLLGGGGGRSRTHDKKNNQSSSIPPSCTHEATTTTTVCLDAQKLSRDPCGNNQNQNPTWQKRKPYRSLLAPPPKKWALVLALRYILP